MKAAAAIGPRVLLGFALPCLLFGGSASARAQTTGKLPELTTAAQVRNLSPEEAARNYPVHLQGVLTFADQSHFLRFVQDDTAGIYFFASSALYDRKLKAGDLVEIRGRSNRGEYAPIIDASEIRRVGDGAFPAAKSVGIEQLCSGQEDSQFLQITGLVRTVEFDQRSMYFLVTIAHGGQAITVMAKRLPGAPDADLVDTTVVAQGVAVTRFNLRRQAFSIRLLAPRPEDLVIAKPPAGDTFESPARPISSLLQFSSAGAYGHRVKVAGTVVYRQAPDLYIEDHDTGLYIRTADQAGLRDGDHVEVLGFAAMGDYNPMLQDGIFRKTSADAPPQPDFVTADQALNGRHDCRLVRLEADVLDRAHRSQDQFLVLQAPGGFIFHAYLPRRGHTAAFGNIQNGSTVAVTGVCVIDPGAEWHAGEDWRAKSFRLLMRSPNDIQVLQAAPWWDLEKILWLVGLLCFFTLAALAWAAALRRRVHQQTAIIQQKMDVEVSLEREILATSNREQRRIGHDLHDGVCQQLAGISLMTASLADKLGEKGAPESAQLERIGSLIQSAIAQTRGVARGLFPVKLEANGLVPVLAELAANASELFKISCQFSTQDPPPNIANDVALHLYYIVLEAVGNAARHGKARHVNITLAPAKDRFALTVGDDGSGFAPPGPNHSGMGLRIMQHRARVIGATLNLQSAPGSGTAITCVFAATPRDALTTSTDDAEPPTLVPRDSQPEPAAAHSYR